MFLVLAGLQERDRVVAQMEYRGIEGDLLLLGVPEGTGKAGGLG